jgi:ferredoxin--NADP+ reductase
VHLAWSVRRANDLNAYKEFIESMPVDFMPIVTQDPDWTGMNKRITTQLSAGTLIPNLYANNKVMICGSMEFNTDIKTMLKDWGWSEGSKRTAGTFVQEKAFVG